MLFKLPKKERQKPLTVILHSRLKSKQKRRLHFWELLCVCVCTVYKYILLEFCCHRCYQPKTVSIYGKHIFNRVVFIRSKPARCFHTKPHEYHCHNVAHNTMTPSKALCAASFTDIDLWIIHKKMWKVWSVRSFFIFFHSCFRITQTHNMLWNVLLHIRAQRVFNLC